MSVKKGLLSSYSLVILAFVVGAAIAVGVMHYTHNGPPAVVAAYSNYPKREFSFTGASGWAVYPYYPSPSESKAIMLTNDSKTCYVTAIHKTGKVSVAADISRMSEAGTPDSKATQIGVKNLTMPAKQGSLNYKFHLFKAPDPKLKDNGAGFGDIIVPGGYISVIASCHHSGDLASVAPTLKAIKFEPSG